MRRISILNFKGGTGKTSVAENLGHALARAGLPSLSSMETARATPQPHCLVNASPLHWPTYSQARSI